MKNNKKRNNRFLQAARRAAAMLAVTLVFGFVLAGCDDGNGGGGGKSVTLSGDLSGLKVPDTISSPDVSVVAYTSSKFTGTPVGKAALGPASSRSVLASRSIAGPARSVAAYSNDTAWEMPLNNLGPDDHLYFAIEIDGGINNGLFLNQIDGFDLDLGGINNGANFNVNNDYATVFENISIDMIDVTGNNFSATGVDTSDSNAFSYGRLVCFDANGAEVGGIGTGLNSTPENVAFHVLLPAKVGTYRFGMEFNDGSGGNYKRAPGRLSNTLTITATEIASGSKTDFDGGTIDLTGYVFP